MENQTVRRPARATIRALAAASLLLLPAGAALGQTEVPPPAGSVPVARPTVAPAKLEDKAEPAPPPALPGAQSSHDIVAPATTSAADMSPTAALFDAINRGDMPAARDAINRGADLGGHNQLGQTPLDLSIDLNRNDITFLLLSMRNENGAMPTGPTGPASPAEAALAAREASATQGPAHPRLRAARTAQVVRARAPMAPRLFADDGGRPDAAAGFMGFAPTR